MKPVKADGQGEAEIRRALSNIAANEQELALFAVQHTFDGGGAAIPVGAEARLPILWPGRTASVTMLANQLGSIEIDVRVDTYDNYPPQAGDSICGGNEPAISAGVKFQDDELEGWTPDLPRNGTLVFHVNSCTAIRNCTISLLAVKK